MIHQALPLLLSLVAIPAQQSEPALNRLINGLAALVVVVVIALCLLALTVLVTALLPQAGQASQKALQQRPWRAFFVGLANFLFLGGISLILFNAEVPMLGVLGLIIVGFLTTIAVFGLSGLASHLGARLAEMQGQEMSALKRVIWGAVVIELAGFLPFVGWLLVTPILLMLSFGSAVLAWRNRKQESEPWQAEEGL